ncbi:unnamed protein product [Orchesella dallaii]|uniref:Uncharacterized protein n=1 Tax=Orchesella dallaii TaxID=48710 RepID=A0ABP1QV42_9HEXA
MICTFCFKAVNYCSENESKDRLLFKRFIDLVQRYFGKNFELKAGLERKVQKMLEVVTAAEKVPSRTKLAKEKLENKEQNGDGSLYKAICKFRKDFKRKCAGHLSSSLPKVIITRIEIENKDEIFYVKQDRIISKTDPIESSEMEENKNLLLGWISTLVGVVWLGWSCFTVTTASTLTTTDDNDELKIQSIINGDDDDDDIHSTATRCNPIPQEESFRPDMDNCSNSQSTILEHLENPAVCHTLTRFVIFNPLII